MSEDDKEHTVRETTDAHADNNTRSAVDYKAREQENKSHSDDQVSISDDCQPVKLARTLHVEATE